MQRPLVAMGHVPGFCQTNDRAELCALVSVVAWQAQHPTTVHLWVDCKFVVDGLLHVLCTGEPGEWAHRDLWDHLQSLLSQWGSAELVPRGDPKPPRLQTAQ